MKQILTIAISGKKGHGKDTLGGFILDAARARGWNTTHKNLADPLKEEAAEAIAIFESHMNYPDKYRGFGAHVAEQERVQRDFDENTELWEPIIQWFCETYDEMTPEQAAPILISMFASAIGEFADPSCEGYNSYDPQIYEAVLGEFNDANKKKSWRILLQWWGTEFRRRLCGDSYWRDRLRLYNANLPDKTVHGVFDIRFPDEFDMVRNELTNGFLIRVERPSVVPDGDQHPSETALDDVPQDRWNAVVVNEVDLDELRKGADIIFLQALMWAGLAT